MIIINVTNNLAVMMKKNIIWKYSLVALGITSVFIFQSCDSESYDVKGETQNLVYINLQEWSPVDCPKNTFLFNVFRTPISAELINGGDVELDVQCTKPASQDIKVTFEIDRNVQLEGYSPFPDDVKVTLDKTELVIPQGEMLSSDKIILSVEDGKWGLFTEDVYLLPIKITSVSHAELSQSLSSAYLAVKTDYTNCVNGATSVAGTKIADRSTWKAVIDGEDAGTAIFDGSTSTYNSFSSCTFEVDLQNVQQGISGIQFNFSNQNYSLSAATVYTSTTGSGDYELQGSTSISRSTSQYVRFYAPVDARYIKIELTAYSTRGIRLSEFNLYKE